MTNPEPYAQRAGGLWVPAGLEHYEPPPPPGAEWIYWEATGAFMPPGAWFRRDDWTVYV